jgi:hypothetical protein
MQDAARALTQQFLAWVAEAPRSYSDAEAWRRSCPHLSIWEDAIADGLIRFENSSSMKESRILLTTRGRSFLKMNCSFSGRRGGNEERGEGFWQIVCLCKNPHE